jgi:PAS domain S-box-containing protein
LLAESLPQLVWTALPDGRLDYTNQRWADYTGLNAEPSRGWLWKEAVHPDDLAVCLDRWATAIEWRSPYEVKLRLRGRDGGYRWFLTRAEPIVDQEKRAVCWFGTCTDVHEQQLQLDQLEERCRRIVDAAHDGIWEVALDGTTLLANHRMASLLGYTVDEMMGRQIFDFLFEDDAAAAREQLQLRENGDRQTFDWRFRRKDGTELWTLASCSPVTRTDGTITGAVGVFADVTERRRSEQRCKESEERFRTSVENLLDCFGIFESVRDDNGTIRDFRVVYVNQAACRNNRRTLEEQIGQSLLELMPAHRHSRLFDEYVRVVETGESLSKEMLFYEDDFSGERLGRWFDIRASKLGDAMVVAWRDVTERKTAEQARRVAEERFGVGVYLYDLQRGVNSFSSEQYTRLTGYTIRDFASMDRQTFMGLFHPDDVARVAEHLQQVVAADDDRVLEVEYRFKTKDGRWIWCQSRDSVLERNQDGSVRRLIGGFMDISDRKLAEESFAEADALIESLFQMAPVGLGVWDRDFRFVRINAALAEINGLPSEVHLGRRPDELLPGLVGLDQVYERWRTVLETGRPWTNVEVCGETLAMPGVKRYWTEHFFPVQFANHTIGIAAICQEETARKRAEEELRESQERLRIALSAAAAVAFVWDIQNDVVIRYFSADPALPVNKDAPERVADVRNKVHPDDRERFDQGIAECMDQGADYRNLYRVVHPDGAVKWLQEYGTVTRGSDGQPQQLTGISIDITDRMSTEEQLRESEGRLSAALEGGRMGMWEWDVRTNEAVWNPREFELLGMHPNDGSANSEQFFERIHPDDRDLFTQSLQKTLRDGQLFYEEMRVIGDDGVERWLAAAGRVQRDARGAPQRMIGVNYDISPQKRAEEALREASRRKDEFLATLAHELRNPLAPIRTGLELMKIAGDDRELLEITRQTMERQTQQLVRLVNDLLDVSRITRAKLDLRRCHVQLSDLIRNAVEASQPFIDASNHHLSITEPDEPIHLMADPHRLVQVLCNLLNNAAKYTPEGGRIEIIAERLGDGVAIHVQDSGIGIPPAMQAQVFDMFAQVDRPQERDLGGLGIGLTLVKSLVELHSGSVCVRSDGENRGSTFTVYLPVTHESKEEARTCETDDPDASVTKRRVLIVDDNEAAASMMGIFIKTMGGNVRIARDGHEACDVAANFQPEIVLMDLGMPGMNGYEAARFIRKQSWGKQMRLIALSGWGQDEDRRKTKEAGFDEHLVKPVDPSDLKRIVAD